VQKSNGSDFCQIKIPNGAHSALGKLITKLCNRRANDKEKSKRRKQQQQHHSSNRKYETVRGDDYQSMSSLHRDDTDLGGGGDDDDESAGLEDRETDYLIPFENEQPFKREYIMRASAPRPAPYSRQSPQRMYCQITNLEFRLAGAFTEDTMFF
jgi:hypothetical protein